MIKCYRGKKKNQCVRETGISVGSLKNWLNKIFFMFMLSKNTSLGMTLWRKKRDSVRVWTQRVGIIGDPLQVITQIITDFHIWKMHMKNSKNDSLSQSYLNKLLFFMLCVLFHVENTWNAWNIQKLSQTSTHEPVQWNEGIWLQPQSASIIA